MTDLYFYNQAGIKISITIDKLKIYSGLGLIKPDTIIENETGQRIYAQGLTDRIKGLKFREELQSPTPPPLEPNPFSASPPVSDNPFSAAVPHASPTTSASASAPVAKKIKQTWWVITIIVVICCGAPIIFALMESRDARYIAAIQEGNLGAVKSFVAWGADVNKVKIHSSLTPLHFAAATGNEVPDGNVEVAEFLISKGANVNSKGVGWTPLHRAAGDGNLELVKLLVSRGADVNIVDYMEGGAKFTPLDEAKIYKQTSVIEYLKSIGARSESLSD